MTKEQLLNELKMQAAHNFISRAEVLQAFEGVSMEPTKSVSTGKSFLNNLTFAKIFSYLGALILTIGIIILAQQNWEIIGTLGRIGITFGFGLVIYISATLFNQREESKITATILFLVSSILITLGLLVIFNEFNLITGTWTGQMIFSSILLVFFGISLTAFRNSIFLLATTLSGTWLIYATLLFLLEQATITNMGDIMAYFTMLIGVAYFLLGQSLEKGRYVRVSGLLAEIGIFAFFIAGLTPGGIMDVIYIGLIALAIYLAIQIKKKLLLITSSLFLAVYLIKMTAEHFSQYTGWPLALIVCGLILIALGYFTVYLNKKYLTV